MKPLFKLAAPVALTLTAGACSLGGLLGGGGKPPPVLFTLTPEAPAPADVARSASAGQAVTIEVPETPTELKVLRVPVQVAPTEVEYVTNLQWADTPDRMFQRLLSETVRRTTDRVVLNPAQTTLDPGIVVSGQLQHFGYDAQTGQVVVTYDAAMTKADGSAVQTRRFEARESADGTAATVAPALNRAANEVALQVAQWIGG
jgi:cholesterol transport system auxiliary component